MKREGVVVGGKTSWTAVELSKLTVMSVHLLHKSTRGEHETSLMDVYTFMHTRNQQQMTDHNLVEELVSRPRTHQPNRQNKRKSTSHSQFRFRSYRKNGWKPGEKTSLFTNSSAQTAFIMTSRSLHREQIRMLECTWFNSDHSVVYCEALMRVKLRKGGKGLNLRMWKPASEWKSASSSLYTQ